MSQEYFTGYVYVAVFLAAGAALVIAGLVFSRLVAPSRRGGGVGFSSYESGEVAVGEAQVQFPARFYIFALLFVVFDIEAIFLLIWATQFRGLGLVGLTVMGIFVGVLAFGLAYAWRKGVLKWT